MCLHNLLNVYVWRKLDWKVLVSREKTKLLNVYVGRKLDWKVPRTKLGYFNWGG